MKKVVAIPFVRVDAKQNPNIRVTGKDSLSQYFRAAVVCFASFRRWNPSLALEFVTNALVPDWFRSELDRLHVDIRMIPFDHRPPSGYVAAFEGSFYILDAIQEARPRTSTLFVDPDVFCIRSIESLAWEEDRVGALVMDYPTDRVVNGLSALDALELAKKQGRQPALIPHYGGEAYLIPWRVQSDLRRFVGEAWEFSLRQFREGNSYYTTEEHLLNFALLDLPVSPLNDGVKRVWTAHGFRTVDGGELALTIWHLPAEKQRGFAEMFDFAVSPDSWFWLSEDARFREIAARVFGIRNRRLTRLLKDSLGRITRSARAVKS